MQRSLLFSAAAAAAVGLFAAGLGLGATGSGGVKLSAKLDAGRETPAPKGAASASGRFTATLSGRSMTWRLTFLGLTGRAVAAHVHLGKPGVAGPVAIPLCGPCASGVHGTVTVAAKLRSALLAGTAYVNVHTAKNPGGEIRGQVSGGGASAAATGQTSTSGTTTSSDGGYGGYG